MLTHGQLFLLTLLAISLMDQVVSSAVAESGRSLRMSRWGKCGDIWCAIGEISLSCLDTVLDSAAAGFNTCPKSVRCSSR